MQQAQKNSPVELVQKLISIHTTRKEASEKMFEKASQDLQGKLTAASSQSDRFTKALLNELSQYGDAVQSEVNRENEYDQQWNKESPNIETTDNPGLSQNFELLEKSLISIYQQIIEENQDLPVSLNNLLVSQLQELKQVA